MKRYQPTLEVDANGYRNMFMSEQPVGNHYSIEEVTAFLREVRGMVETMECAADCYSRFCRHGADIPQTVPCMYRLSEHVGRIWNDHEYKAGTCNCLRGRVLARLDEEIGK